MELVAWLYFSSFTTEREVLGSLISKVILGTFIYDGRNLKDRQQVEQLLSLRLHITNRGPSHKEHVCRLSHFSKSVGSK
jgi:hypothetical protein